MKKVTIGQRYGRLLVVSFIGLVDGRSRCVCKCTCGVEATFEQRKVVSGNTKSCGCLQKEKAAKRLTKHGQAAGAHKQTRTYKTWASMRSRCENALDESFVYYGGRGISVSDEWKKFEAFFADMGERPPGMTIDRIDNNAGYNKHNCKWSTKKEQAINRRSNRFITHCGTTMTASQWSEKTGIPCTTIYRRLKAGLSGDDILRIDEAKASERIKEMRSAIK